MNALRPSLAIGLAFLPSACVAPAPEPLTADALVAGAVERGPEQLDAALALMGELPASFAVPPRDERWNPAADGYWHVHALAFDPRLRQLRRELAASRAEQDSAGAPLPLGLEVGSRELSDLERDAQLTATLELFSIFGFGRRGAEQEMARARVRFLAGDFEAELRAALFAVDRLRVQLWNLERERELWQRVLDEAAPGLARVKAAHEFGVLGPDLHGRALGIAASFREAIRDVDTAIRTARNRLAERCGLQQTDAELGQLTDATWSVLAASERPDTAQLLGRVPALRARQLGYALSEAQLRDEVATQWPSLRLGPRLTWRVDELLTGGVLALSLPWPGSRHGAIAAAVQRRAAAREALVDELLAVSNEIARATAELAAARERESGVVQERLRATEAAWRSTRARVWTRGDMSDVQDWLEAMPFRSAALLSAQRARQRVLLADLDLREARGEQPGMQR